MEFKGFLGGSYQSEAATADDERTVNFFFEKMQSEGAPVRNTLYPTPGVTSLATGTQGPGRAHFAMDSREFAVIGTTLYEVDSAGALTSRGTVALNSDPATISSNGDGGGQLFITSGGNGYVYTLSTNVLASISFLAGKATMGAQLDGYFLALDAATSTMYISDLLAGATWTSTQFAQRSIAPDPFISMVVSGRYIYLFGEYTTELWYNNGASPFPFAPHPSGLLNYGIASKFGRAVLGKEVIWLGWSVEGRCMVLRAAGFTPEVISSYPVQTLLDGYSGVSEAIADSYSDRGHNFFILSFDRQGISWAWDAETGMWCERGTWISAEGRYGAWRPRWHAYAFGKHRMLDANSTDVYNMASSIFTDAGGGPIRRLRRAPALMNENERVFYASFELDLEPGLGVGAAQGVNPHVMMRMSDDGGKTWGNEVIRAAGPIGNYGKRVRWTRLGAARRRVFEVTMTDPNAWRLTNAYINLAQPIEPQRERGR